MEKKRAPITLIFDSYREVFENEPRYKELERKEKRYDELLKINQKLMVRSAEQQYEMNLLSMLVHYYRTKK